MTPPRSTFFPYTTLFRSLGHHIPMVMLGTFILAFGWFGFNAGSSLAGTDGRIGIIAVNTMLASAAGASIDRKSTRLNSSHRCISYAVFCLKKKKLIVLRN